MENVVSLCENITIEENEVLLYDRINVDEYVFDIIYGEGVIVDMNGEGDYPIVAVFSNKEPHTTMSYTKSGIPAWVKSGEWDRVLYTADELTLLDIASYLSPNFKVLKLEEIFKIENKHMVEVRSGIEVRCPSGIWVNSLNLPECIIDEYLEKDALHLFRSSPQKSIN